MVVDRRQKRAVAPLVALEYFLDAERARSGASALGLFVSDEALVASAKDAAAHRELVHNAPIADLTDRDLYVLPMRIGAGTMKLVSMDARVASLASVERAVARILAG